MFRTRAIQFKVVKTPRNTTSADQPTHPAFDIDKINDLAMKSMRGVAIGFVGVYAAVRTIDTLSEIAINFAPKNN